MSDPIVIEPAALNPAEPAEPAVQLTADPVDPATPAVDEDEDSSVAPEPAAAPEEVLPEGVTKDGESYVIHLEGSTYKAASIHELFSELAKGMNEKQRVIRESKAKASIKVPKDFDKQDSEEPTEEWPDETKILSSTFTAAKLDPRLASYSEDQWAALKEEHNLSEYQYFNLRQKVEQAQSAASKEVTKQNVRSANLYQIKQSEGAVQKMISSAGLDPDEFGAEYSAVLTEIWSDPKSRDKFGMISSADIVQKMFDRILPKLTKSQEKTIDKKIRDEKIKAEAVKKAVGGAGGTGAKPKPEPKAPPNLKDGAEELRRRIRQGLI